MMKSALSRQTRLCRLPVSSRPIQAIARISTRSFAPSALSKSCAKAGTAVSSRTSSIWIRQYSSGGEAASPVRESGSQDAEPITQFSDMKLLNVDDAIIHAVTRGMGYQNMTEVQSLTLEPALAGKDLVAQAKTGTGKTLAFLIPVLQRILNVKPSLTSRLQTTRARAHDIQAIILSPTRELAEQIGTEARKLVRNTGVIVQTAVGGTRKREMLKKIQFEGCHLLVATPGRLHDLLSDSSSGVAAPDLAALVLDEADRMLDVGFEEELNQILHYLPRPVEKTRQTLLFSATIPRNVVKLAKTYIDPQNFEFIQTVQPDEVPTHAKVPQKLVQCKGSENLYPTLLELVRREVEAARDTELPFKAIVYLPTTAHVELTTKIFDSIAAHDRDIPLILGIHSKLTQGGRTMSANSFRRAKSAILFSSDVTARGMDFPNVSHVIQLYCPQDREQYIHRLGRTGRADKAGQGWIFLTQAEVPQARSRLTDLPIKPSREFKAATIDMPAAGPETTENEDVRRIWDASQIIDLETYTDAYRSLLGGPMRMLRRDQLVSHLNNLALYGWGLKSPPPVSAGLARNLGLTDVPGMNISATRYDSAPRRSSASDRDDPFRALSEGGGFTGRTPRGPPRSDSAGRDNFARGNFARGNFARGNFARGNSARDNFSRDNRRGSTY